MSVADFLIVGSPQAFALAQVRPGVVYLIPAREQAATHDRRFRRATVVYLIPAREQAATYRRH
jgi:hypothetical protein